MTPRRLALLFFSLLLCTPALRAGDGWTADLTAAKTAAAKENRDLLINFTGSDWCQWCLRLHDEVFSKEVFQKEAPKQFVLVEIDFPQDRELPAGVKARNEALLKEYQVEEFPTLVLADAAGRPYAVTGYTGDEPEAFLKNLSTLRKIREARDAALKNAAAAADGEKARLIMEAFKDIPPAMVHTFYRKEIDEAVAADKTGASGAKKARDSFDAEKAFAEKQAALDTELSALHEAKKFDAFTARVDRFIAEESLTGSRKQEVLMIKLAVLGPDKLEASRKLLSEIIAVDPKSETAGQARMIQENLSAVAGQVEKSKKNGAEEAPDKTEQP